MWATEPGRWHRIEASEDPARGWTSAGEVVAGDGGTVRKPLAARAVGTGFFRVAVEVPPVL